VVASGDLPESLSETSGLAEFHADRAQNPDRLFFDIVHARPWINQKRIAIHDVHDALVRRVRIAETSPATTRVVFDLVGHVEYTVSRLDTPDRIVIELTPGEAKQPSEPLAVPTTSPAQSSGAMPSWTVVRGMPAVAKSPFSAVFVPPVTPRPIMRMIGIPELPAPAALVSISPNQIADSWTSLAGVRLPAKPVSTPAVLASTAPAPKPPGEHAVREYDDPCVARNARGN